MEVEISGGCTSPPSTNHVWKIRSTYEGLILEMEMEEDIVHFSRFDEASRNLSKFVSSFSQIYYIDTWESRWTVPQLFLFSKTFFGVHTWNCVFARFSTSHFVLGIRHHLLRFLLGCFNTSCAI